MTNNIVVSMIPISASISYDKNLCIELGLFCKKARATSYIRQALNISTIPYYDILCDKIDYQNGGHRKYTLESPDGRPLRTFYTIRITEYTKGKYVSGFIVFTQTDDYNFGNDNYAILLFSKMIGGRWNIKLLFDSIDNRKNGSPLDFRFTDKLTIFRTRIQENKTRMMIVKWAVADAKRTSFRKPTH